MQWSRWVGLGERGALQGGAELRLDEGETGFHALKNAAVLWATFEVLCGYVPIQPSNIYATPLSAHLMIFQSQ